MLAVFTKYIPAFYGDMLSYIWKIHRSYLFVLIWWRFRIHRALSPLPSEKLLRSFWRFSCRYTADCSAEDPHALRWDSEKPTNNSGIMYTVQLLVIKGGLTLILSFPKAWFLLRIRRSNFCCFLHRAFYIPKDIACRASKTASIAAEQRALLVFPARNSIWDLFAGWFVNASSIV